MDRWTLLQTCAAQAWNPVWGDPDGLGILLTLLYASAALITCHVAAQLWRHPSPRAGRGLWSLAAVGLVALAINKQLDLQTFLIHAGRCMARADGWYDQRRGLQRLASYAIFAAMALGMVALVRLANRAWHGNRLLIAGLGLLTIYVALRILSLHHMAAGLGSPLFGLALARMIELVSLLMINCAAFAKTRAA